MVRSHALLPVLIAAALLPAKTAHAQQPPDPRLRLRPSVFAVGEFTPRLSGHDPGDHMWGVGLEKSTRGHTLALTLTNSYATTPGQIARGGTPAALYLGFNVTRKF